MSDTPRTDAEIKRLNPFGSDESIVYPNFARQLERELATAKEINRLACLDWADDDTRVKEIAKPYIGDFDGPRPEHERGPEFRGVIEVTEALVEKLDQWRECARELGKANAIAMTALGKFGDITDETRTGWAMQALDAASCKLDALEKKEL